MRRSSLAHTDGVAKPKRRLVAHEDEPDPV